jgi:6,7-dimethyl-8-ribityllumazine synthase
MTSSSSRIALLTGTFHLAEAEIMLEEARMTAGQLGLDVVCDVRVPGSMEKPLALKRLLLSPTIDAVAVLGIIERGQTKHGLVMAQAVIKSIIELELEFMKPVGVGILGPEIDPEQIDSRLRPYAAAAVRAVAVMLK